MSVTRWLCALVAVIAMGGCADRERARADDGAPTESREPGATSTEASVNSRYFSQVEVPPRDFVRRWVRVGDRMQVTGRTGRFAAMTADCTPCDSFVDTVERIYAEGGSADFPGSEVVSIRKARGSASTYLVEKVLAPTVVRHGDGALDRYPGGRETIRVFLEPDGKTWAVTHYTLEPTG